MDPLERIPPQSLEAESSVLGAILLDNEAAWLVAQFLKPEHFYKAANQKIFEVILALAKEQKPIDVVILHDELAKRGALEACGGKVYLRELIDSVPSAANAEHYARLVRDKALLRSLIGATNAIAREAYGAQGPAEAVIDRAEKAFLEVTSRRVTDTATDIRSLLDQEMSWIESGAARKGLMTSLPDLDRATNGFRPSELIVIAARPSMGKTSLATTIIQNVAQDERIPVMFYSMEMSRSQVAQNMLCSHARVDAFKLRNGELPREERRKLGIAAGELAELPILVDDATALSIMELRAKARMAKLRHGIRLVVIDYLQLMEGEKGRSDDNRAQEIATISRGLKQLARELEVPVIALSQLNRSVETREGHKPRLADLRESGAIEQDADMVLLLYREAYYKPQEQDPRVANRADVIVAKNRNGPTGNVILFFHKEYTRFDTWTWGE